MDIRIMTFNIQHCQDSRILLQENRKVIDPARMADVISGIGADICGLNEVRGLGKTAGYTAQAETLASLLGYHGVFGRSIYVNGTEPYGNGLVSRFPIRRMEVIPIPDPIIREEHAHGESRSVLRCELDIGEGFAVYQSHFDLDDTAKEHAAAFVHSLFRREPLPAVLMGDFNMEPDHPYLAPLQRDFCSTDPLLAGQCTYPSHAPEIKIDYIFTNRQVTVRHCEIADVIASDHRPVWADISF